MSYISGVSKKVLKLPYWDQKMGIVIIIVLSKRGKKKGICQKLIVAHFSILQILQLAKCKLSRILAF